jgi:hypothetical protein
MYRPRAAGSATNILGHAFRTLTQDAWTHRNVSRPFVAKIYGKFIPQIITRSATPVPAFD